MYRRAACPPSSRARRREPVLTIGSLFSGVGGLELGLEWAGLGPVLWQVEIEAYCRRVLAKHLPTVDRGVVDVRAASALSLAPVDLICGGFPCQDLSSAGAGAGLEGERSGLWYQFLRVVDECRPFAVVVENVAHGRRRYLCAVRSGLHELGYATTALLVSALETGAPHIRDRCFVVAYPDGEPLWQRPERQPARRPRGLRGQGHAEPRHARQALRWADQPSMGGAAHGAPGGVDRDRRWPARQGEARHPWEPPFAVMPGLFHNERLKAIGNLVAPRCSQVVGQWVVAHVMRPEPR
jgi:DNA (cytosine-5)-methyltransferase 1